MSETLNIFQVLILKALNTPRLGKHVYAGTADPKKVSRNRVKNRMARESRRQNRNK